MEAGTSIKLQSGFKLCNGANFKASIDGSNPVLKSRPVEQLSTPYIAGSKYASSIDSYTVNADDYDAVNWLLLGENVDYSSSLNKFDIPTDLKNGQYTLICRGEKNGQIAAASKIIVVKNAVASRLEADLGSSSVGLNLYPNPTTGIVSINLEAIEGKVNVIVRNLLGKVVAKYNNVSASNPEIDLSALGKGIYFVDLISCNGEKVVNQKIIKQ
ncbi:MAG: T9SS type A sorting domain-containing protein [Prolixibacteraceae bacterium]|jgi:hypothetical protein|nr:T9SS type A sorting domain-containing protein [Prolixibacteraceae bacterium]